MFHRFATRGFSNAARSIAAKQRTRFVVNHVAKPAVAAVLSSSSSLSSPRHFSTDPSKTNTNPDMMCRQCEQTKDHFACTTVGVCGKTAETSAMQDTLMHVVKTISLWANAAREAGMSEEQLHAANVWTIRSVFSTLTNVNFSEDRIAEYIKEGMAIKKDLEKLVPAASAPTGPVAEVDLSGKTLEELEEFGYSVSIPVRQAAMGNEDCFSLNEIATYGSKGAAAYAAHCYQLGKMDDSVMKDMHEVYCKLSSDEADMEGLLANALKVGDIGYPWGQPCAKSASQEVLGFRSWLIHHWIALDE